MLRDDYLIRRFYAFRMILTAMEIAKADVDGCDPLVREDLHVELDRVLHGAAEAGLPRIDRDAVRILEAVADEEATEWFDVEDGG